MKRNIKRNDLSLTLMICEKLCFYLINSKATTRRIKNRLSILTTIENKSKYGKIQKTGNSKKYIL